MLFYLSVTTAFKINETDKKQNKFPRSAPSVHSLNHAGHFYLQFYAFKNCLKSFFSFEKKIFVRKVFIFANYFQSFVKFYDRIVIHRNWKYQMQDFNKAKISFHYILWKCEHLPLAAEDWLPPPPQHQSRFFFIFSKKKALVSFAKWKSMISMRRNEHNCAKCFDF